MRVKERMERGILSIGIQASAQMRETPRTGPSSGILDSPVLSIVFTDRIRAPFAEKMLCSSILAASSIPAASSVR